VSFTGVSLLDLARPRDGYRTTAAVATTYSADLVACLALLVALDGGGGDQLKFGKIESLRALERLRHKVRIISQQGRIAWSKRADGRILGLFDSILRAVPFNGNRQSFHPKLLLARHSKALSQDRYVLAVGSRNLTMSTDWDFGIGLVGYASGKGSFKTNQLKGIAGFLDDLADLIEEPGLPRPFQGVDEVYWQLPEGVDQARFYFRSGKSRGIHDTELTSMPSRGKALLVSPFLDVSMVQHAAAHFKKADSITLVSGKADLDKIANSKAGRLLGDRDGSIEAYSMFPASDDAPPAVNDDEDPELPIGNRDLHAKIFCIADQNGATSIIGSANLTSRAWLGKNWETYVVLRGSTELADEVWNWVKTRAAPYRPEEAGPAADSDPIDILRNQLAETDMVLVDYSERPSKLRSETLGSLLALSGCTLNITRLTTPDSWVTWDASSTEIELPSCRPDERTRLLRLRAKAGKTERSWVHMVRVEPAIGLDRDQQAFVRILGIDDFLRYLQSLVNDSVFSTDDTKTPGIPKGRDPIKKGIELFHLEDLLRKLNRDGGSLQELDETVERYSKLFEQSAVKPEDHERLQCFTSLWAAISAGMHMP
jgi:HKD family nuclease